MNYCNYHNAEWCKRFNGLKSMFYETRIVGNTLYVIPRRSFLDNLFHRPQKPAYCTIVMVNLSETILIEKLKEYGLHADTTV